MPKQPKSKPSKSSPSTAPPPPPPPSWPPFPSLPITDLTPIPLYPPSSPSSKPSSSSKLQPESEYNPPKILLVKTFFPRSLAHTYLSFLRTLPLATTPPPAPHRRAELAARVNDRFQVHDARFAHALWTRTGLMEALVGEGVGEDLSGLWNGEVVGLNPNIRIYRYTPGQFFDCHYDDSNVVMAPSSENPDELVPARTTWTLLLYLTSEADGCVGGETVFYPNDNNSPEEALAVAPETGMLLLHKHGHDCMLHEGKLVTAGEKWVLRTDLCIKR